MKRWLSHRPVRSLKELIPALEKGSKPISAGAGIITTGVAAAIAIIVGSTGAVVKLTSVRQQFANLCQVPGSPPLRSYWGDKGLPVSAALAVIPRNNILIWGVIDLALATLVAVGLLLLAASPRWCWLFGTIVLVFLVPLSVPGMSWVVASVVVGVSLLVSTRRRSRFGAGRLSAMGGRWAPIAVAFLAALGVVIGRYADPPTRFPTARVFSTADANPDPNGGQCPGLSVPSSLACLDGVYLGEDASNVYLGLTIDNQPQESGCLPPRRTEEIVAIPDSEVKQVVVVTVSTRTSRDVLRPKRSILGDLMGYDFSATPFEVWRGGVRYQFSLLS